MSLTAALLDPNRRAAVVRDASSVLEAEVADKGGLTGIAVKGAFAVVKKALPNFVPMAIDGLLDDFARQLDPFVTQWRAKGGQPALPAYFVAQGPAIADALLAITDERARHSKHKTLKGAYEQLRPKGKEHVVAAMRRVGELIGRHVT